MRPKGSLADLICGICCTHQHYRRQCKYVASKRAPSATDLVNSARRTSAVVKLLSWNVTTHRGRKRITGGEWKKEEEREEIRGMGERSEYYRSFWCVVRPLGGSIGCLTEHGTCTQSQYFSPTRPLHPLKVKIDAYRQCWVRGESPMVWLIRAVVCLLTAPRV